MRKAKGEASHGGSRDGETRKSKNATSGNRVTRGGSPAQLPLQLQQLVLNIFNNALSIELDHLPRTIQEVKHHLYNREFLSAFEHESLREAYALRWSPSRALAYLHIFAGYSLLTDSSSRSCGYPAAKQGSRSVVNEPADRDPYSASYRPAVGNPDMTRSKRSTQKIVCLGGGAGAELVALAAYLHMVESQSIADGSRTASPSEESPPRFDCKFIDIANWSSIIHLLHTGATTAPSISKYASADARTANRALVEPDGFEATFVEQDILEMKTDVLRSLFEDVTLVTIMFTLNELYSASMSSTTQFLLSLTACVPAGAQLLVVDSPGTYSTVHVGKTSATHEATDSRPPAHTANTQGVSNNTRKYPMQWLLDHTLLDSAAVVAKGNTATVPRWEKLEGQDSQWHRLDPTLTYPIDLEDMRYQLHLYRKL